MRRYIIILTVALLAGAIVYFVTKKEDAQIQVLTTQAKNGTITNVVTATGTVEPITQVEVGTQVSGTIEKIYVDYNSEVKKGQILAELDKSTLRATLAEAQATLRSAETDQQYQQKNFDRISQLYKGNVVSETDYDDALYALNNAKIVTEQGKSDVARAQTNLSYATIYSPIDGVVLSRDVDEGQTVAASYSTPTLFTIAQDLKLMQVEADVDEADIGQVKLAQRVSFTVDAYPDDIFSGQVTQIRLEPTETSSVITYTVIIKADNPDGKLMPGLTANITIYTEELKDVLTLEMKALNFEPDMDLLMKYEAQVAEETGVTKSPPAPAETITADDTHPVVWVKNGTNIAPQQIEVGSDDGINTQVISGLTAGQDVVYQISEVTTEEATDNAQSSSPFMPKPPGSKKK